MFGVLRFSAADCVNAPISDHISYRHAAACLRARIRGARRSSWSCPSGTDRSETDTCEHTTEVIARISRQLGRSMLEWSCPHLKHIPALDFAHTILVLLPGLLGVVPRLERAGCKSNDSSISACWRWKCEKRRVRACDDVCKALPQAEIIFVAGVWLVCC